MSRYLPETANEDEPDPGEAGAVVVAGGREGFRNQVEVDGGHRMWADEPEAVGGTNAGPTPYDYLLAGLGACTSMTLRMYADRKQWPLEHVRVTLEHEKIHAKDCEACETETGKVDRIRRRIALTGELDETQRARLLEIADRCPVHRTLHAEVRVETEEAT